MNRRRFPVVRKVLATSAALGSQILVTREPNNSASPHGYRPEGPLFPAGEQTGDTYPARVRSVAVVNREDGGGWVDIETSAGPLRGLPLDTKVIPVA